MDLNKHDFQFIQKFYPYVCLHVGTHNAQYHHCLCKLTARYSVCKVEILIVSLFCVLWLRCFHHIKYHEKMSVYNSRTTK